jgi:hypothetical protein
MNLLISTTSPNEDGYDNSGNKVLARFYNNASSGIDTYSVDQWLVNRFVPQNHAWVDFDATSANNSFSTFTTNDCRHSRNGQDLLIVCKLQSTAAASEARIDLPSSLTTAGVSLMPTIQPAGFWFQGLSTTTHGGAVLVEPSVTYLTYSGDGVFGSGTLNPLAKVNASTGIGSGNLWTFTARVPIAGWSN